MSEILQDTGALRAWVERNLKLHMPRHAFCPGHHTPMAYLEHAYFETEKDVVVWGPRGGGKTRLAAVATLLDLLHKPGVSVRILGGSLEQSLRVWEHLLPDVEAHASGGDLKKVRAKRIELETGSSVAVLTQSQKAVRGQRVQKMRCDELELFDPEIWRAVTATTRSLPRDGNVPVGGAIEVFSTHHQAYGLMGKVLTQAKLRGTKIINWCILDVMARCTLQQACSTCELYAECGGRAKLATPDGIPLADGFVPVEDIIAIKQRMSQEAWDCEMLCRHPRREGRVFPGFREDIHVAEFEPDFDLGLGVDFGFCNPFVALWIGKDKKGKVHVVDEWVQKGRTVSEHIHEIQSRRWIVSWVGCDPAGQSRNEQTAKSSVSLLKQAGFKVKSCGSSIQEGLEILRHLIKPAFGLPKLVVHPRCSNLIRALGEYHYPDKGQTEVPEKDGEHDHLIDALRYWLVNAFRPQDKSRQGY